MAYNKDVKLFALTAKFLNQTVFPKYPEIKAKIQAESFAHYNKNVFKPMNELRKSEIIKANKKSTYREIQINDINDKN